VKDGGADKVVEGA